VINKSIAPRNVWDAGESWTLTDQPRLHVLQERMPPGTAERRHLHGAVTAPGDREPDYLRFSCPPPIRSGFGPEGAI